jgi:hypothetical protein
MVVLALRKLRQEGLEFEASLASLKNLSQKEKKRSL